MNETITITCKEYRQLRNDSLFLSILQDYGVDNWEWYDDAVDEYKRCFEKDDE